MGAHRAARTGARQDTIAIYDPQALRTHKRLQRISQTLKRPLPTRFPDEDRAYEPVRGVHTAKLQRNALPPPAPAQRGYEHEVPRKRYEKSAATSRAIRHERHRLANLADSELWQFQVQYAPSREIQAEWETAEEDEQRFLATVAMSEAEEKTTMEHSKAQLEATRQDYAQYLYFASKYGALDAMLYCCSPYPGRVYAGLVDQSARKLQIWGRQRIVALRKYWVTVLARKVTEENLDQGIHLVCQALAQQQRAATYLGRLRWRHVAAAFRSWNAYTQRQIEVRWRFQFSLQEDLRSRFYHWRQRVHAIKEFKKQLKQVARRKQMVTAFEQWQQWKRAQEKLRVHLTKQWLKLQRDCFAQWNVYAIKSKCNRQAACLIQRIWRGSRVRRSHLRQRRAALCIHRVARGWRDRCRVRRLQIHLDVAKCLERIENAILWEEQRALNHELRETALKKDLEWHQRARLIMVEASNTACSVAQSELLKVVKNKMHYRLQEKIQELESSGMGDFETVDRMHSSTRSAHAINERALAFLMRDIARIAQSDALEVFLKSDPRPMFNQLAASQEQVCPLCQPTNELFIKDHGQLCQTVATSCGCKHYAEIGPTSAVSQLSTEELTEISSRILNELDVQDEKTTVELIKAKTMPHSVGWRILLLVGNGV